MLEDRFRRVLAAGQCLFREGDVGSEAYVIESGRIQIASGTDDSQRVVAVLNAQDIFGELALMGDQTRTATATALESTVLTVLTHEYLAERMHAADPMLRHLLRVVLTRGREMMQTARRPQYQKPGDDTSVLAETDASADRAQALQRLRIVQDLERALDREEFALDYQPIVRLSDGHVAGFEALLRWHRPGLGVVPPGDFVAVAEESGLIVPIGRWIIVAASEGLARIEYSRRDGGEGSAPLFVSVNLSGRQLGDPELLPQIEAALQSTRLKPAQLRLEITETLMMQDLHAALDLFERCKALGIKLAVDDFGTGYSSLSYLHRLPIDTLKLDRSFIGNLEEQGAGRKIVAAIVGLARELEIEVVAEGIETARQAEAAQLIGIAFAQGFHYSAGVPLEDAVAMVNIAPNPQGSQ